MRRFEFVAGSSAKFWMGGVEGNNFVVVFGRLGTAGQRKDKAFPTEEAARRELEKKIAEKLREGYTEVAQGGAGSSPAPGSSSVSAATKGPAPRPPLPPRVEVVKPTPDKIEAAHQALTDLLAALGRRSFIVGQRARRARRALEAIAGYDPAPKGPLGKAFEELMSRVVASDRRRLSPRLALELLVELDVAAFERALQLWQQATAPQVAVLREQAERLGDAELSLRLAALLSDRPEAGGGTEAGWARRWQALQPHLSAYLLEKGTSMKDYLQRIDPRGDRHLARRLSRMGG